MLQHGGTLRTFSKWKKVVTKATGCIMPFIWNIQNSYSHRNEKPSVARGYEEGELEESA